MLNGHEWVEHQARKQTLSSSKEGNCFVGGSFQALDRLADTLCDEHVSLAALSWMPCTKG